MSGPDGYVGWSAFEQGEIMQIWKSTIEMEKWFDPDFQQFVDKELIPRTSNWIYPLVPI